MELHAGHVCHYTPAACRIRSKIDYEHEYDKEAEYILPASVSLWWILFFPRAYPNRPEI
jgi:hypothetical protein